MTEIRYRVPDPKQRGESVVVVGTVVGAVGQHLRVNRTGLAAEREDSHPEYPAVADTATGVEFVLPEQCLDVGAAKRLLLSLSPQAKLLEPGQPGVFWDE